MSLVSSDSEGEQNELRNLQEKLESTMKLVSNLSSQLTELKDQVPNIEKMFTKIRPIRLIEKAVLPDYMGSRKIGSVYVIYTDINNCTVNKLAF